MIQKMSNDELKEMMEKNEIMMNEIPHHNQTRGHIDYVGIKMISEDGTNFLQGVAQMETYAIKKGICAKLSALWVAPECRNIGFGKVLAEHMEKEVIRHIHEMDGDHVASLVVLPSGSNYAERVMESIGYGVTGHSKGRINMGKEY